MTWGLVIAGVGAAVGGVAASSASKSAAKTQANSANAATQAQREMFDKQVELQQPWQQTGQQGLNLLSQYLGLTTPQQAQTQATTPVFDEQAYLAANPDVAAEVAQGKLQSGKQHYDIWGHKEGRNAPMTTGGPATGAAPPIDANLFGSLLKPFSQEDFQSDPGYQFRQSEGEKGLQRAASAQGGIGSGRFLKDAMRFNQGLASQDYGAAFDRFNVGQTNIFNRLASASGIGQTAANQTGAAASNFGSQIGSNIIGAGNALAAGQVGSANAFNNAAGQGASMYQQNQLMNRFFPQGSGYGSTSSYGAWNDSPMSSTIYGNGSLGD
jgi:hypothetical protein